jgi:hypothetical protein
VSDLDALPKPERIQRSDVTYLYHIDYYDGPMSGACLWRGQRYRFECVNEEFRPTGQPDEDGDECVESVRTFNLVELTPEEWALEDERRALFRECVGTHCEYDPVTQRRTVGALKPRSDWHRFYEVYKNRAPKRLVKREPVATYES